MLILNQLLLHTYKSEYLTGGILAVLADKNEEPWVRVVLLVLVIKRFVKSKFIMLYQWKLQFPLSRIN